MATGRIPINGTAAIQETIVDAKGDLIVGTGADAVARLAVGTNGHTLVADSSVSPQGLKWAVDPVADVITTAGDLLYGSAADTVARLGIGTAGQVLKVNSGATAPEWGSASSAPSYTSIATGSLPAASSLTISGISGKNDLILVIVGWSGSTATPSINVKLNNDATDYYTAGMYHPTASSTPYAMLGRNWGFAPITQLNGGSLDATGSTGSLYLTISGCNAAGVKPFRVIGSAGTPTSANTETFNYGGYWDDAATISSLVITINAGNFDAGSYYLYGA